ncbi:MAG: glycosyltransferase [Elusimicrobia bacterium]|nr:glycosyltransferase [Candidatus Liberimonas magnetica]
MQSIFGDKNLLLLYCDDNNQNHKFHLDILSEYFKESFRLNIVKQVIDNGIGKTQDHIRHIIDNKGISVVIVFPYVTNFDIPVEFYASLRNKVNLALWLFDDDQYFNAYNKYYAQAFDTLATMDYLSVFAYKNIGIPAVLYFASHLKERYHPVNIKKDIDVCFVGDCKKNDRMEYIQYLAENKIKIKAFGRGSNYGFLEWDKFSETFSRSRINLNFTKIDKLNWLNKDDPLLKNARQAKARPIEIALTGSFCLSEYSPQLNAMFEIGKEIDVFGNKKELLEKVNYYLSNPEKLDELAKNSYQRALNNYESRVYIPRVLNEFQKAFKRDNINYFDKDKIYLSNSFKLKSIIGLTFTVFVQLSRLKLFNALETFLGLFKYGPVLFLKGFYLGAIRVFANRWHKYFAAN